MTAQLHDGIDAPSGIRTIEIHSLALEPHGDCQTATITLVDTTSTIPPSVRACVEHSITQEYGGRSNPAVDKQFLGLTTLFAPPLGDHQVESVSILEHAQQTSNVAVMSRAGSLLVFSLD